MSNPRSESEGLDSEPSSADDRASEALLPEALLLEELSPEALFPEELEILARARLQRRAERVPDDVRQRALACALREAAAPEVVRAVPAAPLVSVARPSLRFGLRLFTVAALVFGSILGAPLLFRTLSTRLAQAPEPQTVGDWQASGPAGELLSRASPLLRLPLLPLPEAAPSASGPSLFAEHPFAQQARAWQVRRWNDPKDDPYQPALYDFKEGALCVTLGAGERVLGGWPWPAPGAASPEKVRISRGRAYRLAFKAWVRGPLPSQLLLGVGHIEMPFVAAAAARVQVSPEPERFAMDFVASHDDDAVGVAFLATNARDADPTRVCIGDVMLGER